MQKHIPPEGCPSPRQALVTDVDLRFSRRQSAVRARKMNRPTTIGLITLAVIACALGAFTILRSGTSPQRTKLACASEQGCDVG